MTEHEREVIRAVVKALRVRRNRFGKLDGDLLSAADMDKIARGHAPTTAARRRRSC